MGGNSTNKPQKCDCGQTAVVWKAVHVGASSRGRKFMMPLCANCAAIEGQYDQRPVEEWERPLTLNNPTSAAWLREACQAINMEHFRGL